MDREKCVLQDADQISNRAKMYKDVGCENSEELYVEKSAVRSFYGNKNKDNTSSCKWPGKCVSSNTRQTLDAHKFKRKRKKVKSVIKLCSSSESPRIDSGVSSQSESLTSSNSKKIHFPHHDDIFWTTNIYGKKSNAHNKINRSEKCFQSVESQTSFSDSQTSTGLSSPISSFRESPFINSVDDMSEQSQESTKFPKDVLDEIRMEVTVHKNRAEGTQMNSELVVDDRKLDYTSTISLIDTIENSHDSSFRSEGSADENKLCRKTPQKSNTILKYFKQTDSLKKVNTPKVSSTPKQNQLSSRNTSHQLVLKGGKLSPNTQSSR